MAMAALLPIAAAASSAGNWRWCQHAAAPHRCTTTARMQPQSPPPQHFNKGAPTKRRGRQGAATGSQPAQLPPPPPQQQQPGLGAVPSAATVVTMPHPPSKGRSPLQPRQQQPDPGPEVPDPEPGEQPDPRPEEPQEPVTEATLQDVHTLFQSSLLQEYAYWVDERWVSGQIPKELFGTYYRNGPALHVGAGRCKRHLFDGDGMLLSLSYSGGRAFFRNKYVRTQGFVAEQAAGRPLYRSSFSNGAADGGLWRNPFKFKFKNVANTGVLSWAGKLLALWEGGLPHEVNPWSLETLGESRLGGALQGSTLSAHYRITHECRRRQHQHSAVSGSAADSDRGGDVPGGLPERRLIVFGAEFKPGGTAVTFMEFDEAGEHLHTTTHVLEGVPMAILHDAAVTEHYYVLLVGPTAFDMGRFFGQYVWGGCSIAQCLRHDASQPSQVLLIPRPGRPSGLALELRCLEVPPCFSFHHINAFEVPQTAGHEAEEAAGQGQQPPQPVAIVLDTILLREMDLDKPLPTSLEDYNGGSRREYHRLVMDLATGTTRKLRLLRRTVEFPATDPRVASRPHLHAWMITDVIDDHVRWGPHQAVVRVTVPPTLGVSNDPSAGAVLPVPPAAAAAGMHTDFWYAGPRRHCGEPMLILRPNPREEGDGWLLLVVHDAEQATSDIVILEALALARGPVATIRLPHHLPFGLHGCWEGDYRGPDPADRACPPCRVTGTIRDYR